MIVSAAFFSEKLVKAAESSPTGGLSSSVINTNWWITGTPRLATTYDFLTVLGFPVESTHDYWGNLIRWNPTRRTSAPFVGIAYSPCRISVSTVPSF